LAVIFIPRWTDPLLEVGEQTMLRSGVAALERKAEAHRQDAKAPSKKDNAFAVLGALVSWR
jgi:hypothetical protein